MDNLDKTLRDAGIDIQETEYHTDTVQLLVYRNSVMIKGDPETLYKRVKLKFGIDLNGYEDKVLTNPWIYSTDRLPLCYETGGWDGKRSDLVLAETERGVIFLAKCYEGSLDGTDFFNWYQLDSSSGDEYELATKVIKWMKIPD